MARVWDYEVGVLGLPRSSAALRDRAAALAERLSLPVPTTEQRCEVLIVVERAGLGVRWRDPAQDESGKPRTFRIDLTSIDTASPAGRSLKQPIARAVGLGRGDAPRPDVLDATAGLGEDAWLLAALGCAVTAVERHPVVFALLEDALERASQSHPGIAQRITAVNDNALELLIRPQIPDPSPHPSDIIYLDPMFPPRRKAALERKPLRLLRRLAGDDDDSASLLDAALPVARRRVVVKRPLHAEPLAGRAPAATHKGKAHRYDIYPTG